MIKLFVLGIAGVLGSTAYSQAQEKIALTPELVAAAEKEGEVTVQYSDPVTVMQAVVKEFNKKYPGIRVNLERKAGTAGVQVLVQEYNANVDRVDLFIGSDIGANKAVIDAGALVAIEPENASDYEDSFFPMAPYVYYPDKATTVVMYNSDLVTDEEAKKLRDWKGILDPAFKGRVNIVEPVFGVTLAPLLYVMNAPDMGEAFLKELKKQEPAIYINSAQSREAVISGRQPIAWGVQWDAIAFSVIDTGAPIRFVYTDPTVEWWGQGWGILKRAPHPNAARLFFAWGMSREGALAYQGPESYDRYAMKDLEDTRETFKKISKEPWYAPVPKTWNPDLNDWINNASKYQAEWQKIMK